MNFKCLLILPLLVASLQAASVSDLTFTQNDAGTEYIVSDCDRNASGSLNIPSIYNGLPVTSIGDFAFVSCTNLSSITIPDSVTSIGNSAFSNCTSLTSITIPDSVTSIGSQAFDSCSSLTSITIPDSVTSIGSWAFFYCMSLSSITIPDSVTSIGDSAFQSCLNLSSITIGNSVTSIGVSAFHNCTSLSSITIPSSVTSIGIGAFSYCTSLASAQFDGDAPSIGSQVFGNTQVSYMIVGAANAAAYGGDGATYGGLVVLDRSKIATAANLYTLDDIKDLRVGSTMIEVSEGNADIRMTLEETSDLSDWSNATTSEKTIEVDAPAGTRFFRFKMAE